MTGAGVKLATFAATVAWMVGAAEGTALLPRSATQVAAACTRLRRENCEELDRYCVYNDCLIVRNDNNKYRACARACGEALSACEAGCDDQ